MKKILFLTMLSFIYTQSQGGSSLGKSQNAKQVIREKETQLADLAEKHYEHLADLELAEQKSKKIDAETKDILQALNDLQRRIDEAKK